MKNKILTLALVAVLFGVTSQASASISVTSPVLEDAIIPGNNDFASDLGVLGFDSIYSGELSFSSSYLIEFYFHASESGYTNSFEIDGTVVHTEVDQAWAGPGLSIGFMIVSAGETVGLAPNDRLEFTGVGLNALLGSAGFGIFGDSVSGTYFSDGSDPVGPRMYFGYDDDGAGPDDNHDDMIISARFLLIPEPMSLAVWAGLFGVCVLRRRRA